MAQCVQLGIEISLLVKNAVAIDEGECVKA